MTTEQNSQKVALVTGASRGIGSAITQSLGNAGLIVVGTATTDEGASAISTRLREQGIAGEGKKLRVEDQAEVAAVVAAVTESYGAPLVVVNNAGITRDNILLKMKADQWDEVININLGSVYHIAKACLRGMTKARWGRIINIGSVVGAMGNAGQANYAAAKAGIAGFSRALARELGGRAITVNTVAPGFIDTDMTRALPDSQREALLGEIPLARLGTPEEIAAVVAFLASDAGAYITGETIHVNGGMYMN